MTYRPLRPLAFSTGIAVLALSSSALAGDAAAEALFQEGKRLQGAGDWTAACPKYEESLRLEAKLGTLFHLAQCFEKIGKTASAWEQYLEVASKAKSEGSRDKEQFARDRAKELEPKLVRLKINVTDRSPGLVVKRGTTAIGSAQWGLGIPVDPGRLTVSAVAPGRAPWSEVVEVKGEGQVVIVIVPQLQPGMGPPPPGYPPGYGPPPPRVGPYNPYGYPPPPQQPLTVRRSVGLVAGGGVMIGLGLLFTLGGGVGAWAATQTDTDPTAGVVFAVLGLAMVGGGIPMVVVGSQRVPAQPEPGMAPPPPPVSKIPELKLGPGNVSATWQF